MDSHHAKRLLALSFLAVIVSGSLWLSSTPAAAQASEDCAMCHENIAHAFEATVHGRIAAFETYGQGVGCVTCHGDGAEHIDSGGEPDKIRRFDESTLTDEVTEICLGCHVSESVHDWQGSVHALNGVGCNDCHKSHVSADRAHGDPLACYDCHPDVQAQFEYPSHHPVREGHMRCGSCHTPHGTSIGMLKNEERPAELCFDCHTYLQGPYIFEHEPVSEGCDTCHEPHGAIANNLLVQNEPFLCLQCHEFHFHAGLEGEEEDYVHVDVFDPDYDTDALPRPTYPNGEVPNRWRTDGYRRAYTTKCTQCHTMVHGSDSPSQTVPGLGQGLTR